MIISSLWALHQLFRLLIFIVAICMILTATSTRCVVLMSVLLMLDAAIFISPPSATWEKIPSSVSAYAQPRHHPPVVIIIEGANIAIITGRRSIIVTETFIALTVINSAIMSVFFPAVNNIISFRCRYEFGFRERFLILLFSLYNCSAVILPETLIRNAEN